MAGINENGGGGEGLELFSVPHGALHESALNSRYRWSCSGRGDVPFVILQICESGFGFFELGGRAYRVGPGEAFISVIPEAGNYYYPEQGTEPWGFSWLNFYGPPAVRLMSAFRNEFGVVVRWDNDPAVGVAFRELAREAGAGQGDRFDLSARVYGFVMLWAASLRRPPSDHGRLAEAAMQHISTFYYEPLNVKIVAMRFGVSREHFTRVFAAHYGISPAEALRIRRARAASELLASSSLPLSEVARRSGFSDVRQMRRALA